jgi:chorismate dehydratase
VVVLVNNVSVEPFRLQVPRFASLIRDEAPSRAWMLAMSGEVDLAVLPVARIADVASTMEPIGDFGVACKGAVRSVLLLGDRSVADLVAQRRPIYLTTQSETSRRLLRLLCLREFGTLPVFAPTLAGTHGRLCIGDDALRRRQDAQGWPVVADLCEWWHRQTGLPFVFARWMVRRSAPAELKRATGDWLAGCVALAAQTAGRQRMVHKAMRAGLFGDPGQATGYFEALRSRLVEEDRQGERLFLQQPE